MEKCNIEYSWEGTKDLIIMLAGYSRYAIRVEWGHYESVHLCNAVDLCQLCMFLFYMSDKLCTAMILWRILTL